VRDEDARLTMTRHGLRQICDAAAHFAQLGVPLGVRR